MMGHFVSETVDGSCHRTRTTVTIACNSLRICKDGLVRNGGLEWVRLGWECDCPEGKGMKKNHPERTELWRHY